MKAVLRRRSLRVAIDCGFFSLLQLFLRPGDDDEVREEEDADDVDDDDAAEAEGEEAVTEGEEVATCG